MISFGHSGNQVVGKINNKLELYGIHKDLNKQQRYKVEKHLKRQKRQAACNLFKHEVREAFQQTAEIIDRNRDESEASRTKARCKSHAKFDNPSWNYCYLYSNNLYCKGKKKRTKICIDLFIGFQ